MYRHVDDVDGIYGALHSRELVDEMSSELIIAEHEGKFDTTMQIYDSIFQQGHRQTKSHAESLLGSPGMTSPAGSYDLSRPSRVSAHSGLVHSLQQLGCSHLVDRYMHDLNSSDPSSYMAIADAHYEAAWRTSNWDLHSQSLMQSESSSLAVGGSGLHTSLFHSLRSIHDLTQHHKNVYSFDAAIIQARTRIAREVSSATPETTKHVFPAIVHLQLLADMEKAWKIIDRTAAAGDQMEIDMVDNHSSGSSDSSSSFASFERRGRDRLCLVLNDFDMVEPIMALRGVILQLACEPSILASHLRFIAAVARQSNRRTVGGHAIRSGISDPNIPVINKLALRLEEAQLNWSEGLSDTAIRAAKHIVQSIQAMQSVGRPSPTDSEMLLKLLVDSSCLAAEWMSKSHSESSTVIQRYITHASQAATSSQSSPAFVSQQQHRCYYQLACFMDRTFQGLYSKSISPEHEAARDIFRSNEEKIRKLNESMQDPQVQIVMRARDSSDEKIIAARHVLQSKQNYIRRLQKEHDIDAQQHQQFDRSLAQALEQAILNYALCLVHGDRYDTQVVYRLLALWFNHYADAPCQHNTHAHTQARCNIQILKCPSDPAPPYFSFFSLSQLRPISCMSFVSWTPFPHASSYRWCIKSLLVSVSLMHRVSRPNRNCFERIYAMSDKQRTMDHG